jgi:hypothetical protein
MGECLESCWGGGGVWFGCGGDLCHRYAVPRKLRGVVVRVRGLAYLLLCQPYGLSEGGGGGREPLRRWARGGAEFGARGGAPHRGFPWGLRRCGPLSRGALAKGSAPLRCITEGRWPSRQGLQLRRNWATFGYFESWKVAMGMMPRSRASGMEMIWMSGSASSESSSSLSLYFLRLALPMVTALVKVL